MSKIQTFIDTARAVHGSVYDYSEAQLLNLADSVSVICPTHGAFTVIAKSHIYSKQRCKECIVEERKQNFLSLAKGIHDNKYDYSKVVYTNSINKVIIICRTHGEFEQKPATHISGGGSGCSLCAKESITHTKEIFIEKAKTVHGDKYDYRDVQYKNNGTKVAITCPNHGAFYQTPGNHLSGYGCFECRTEYIAGLKRLSSDEFEKRARDIHGNKYDHSKIHYKSGNQEITLTCPTHGDFKQIANSYLKGVGCPECVKTQRRTDFILKAKERHGDKFGYDYVEYTRAEDEVSITCPVHGNFKAQSRYHLQGAGCPQCDLNARKKNFLQKAIEIHGSKYDYSRVDYINAMTPVTMICPTHGEFQQSPGSHTAGYGCFKCGVVSRRLSREEFIERATLLHKGYYDYSKIDFIDRFTKVAIVCPVHGEFTQTPEIHLKGCGCTVCNASIGERVLTELLNKHKIKYLQQHRIPGNRCRYDFYLCDYHTLIEFHGVQHYNFVEYFHKTIEEFNRRKLVDEMKGKLAKAWDIPLLIVNYKHLEQGEEFIENILLEFINHRGNPKGSITDV